MIDEVLADVRVQAVVFVTKGDAEENEAALRGDNFGLRCEMGELQTASEVDAKIGYERWGGGAEGDMDEPLAIRHLAGCGGGVGAVGEVGRVVKEDEAAA